MPKQRKYVDFFDIDKEFYKCVSEEIFIASPSLWKNFYPHQKFQRMLGDVISVLTGGRSGKESVWVEGAYGTGKSYAVLTLKKLLDASQDEVNEYFTQHSLPSNMLGKLLSIKKNCKLLTVFRNGSANILSDRDLIVSIQESIRIAMKEQNFVGGEEALKNKGIEWLSETTNSTYFQSLIDEDERCRLTGKTVASIISELNNSTDRDYIVKLIRLIDEVGREKNVNIFQPDIAALLEWIKGIIQDNQLSAIIFIWDEFTEFFKNNRNRLTDFQSIVNLSNVTPFYFIPVTHVSGGLFSGVDDDKKKILGRFIEPTSRIELPDGIAFELIGAALQHTKNDELAKEWKKVAEEINGEMRDARLRVAERVNIDEGKMREILPLHPYAALVLKYLAEKFQSNQRSMFDFIKADNGDDIKAFQWFIKNHGPFGDDKNKLLTVDWLWDFFYEKGKNELSPDIRAILDAYNRQNALVLDERQKRIFKTILMFIATSRSVGDAEELLIPNSDNVRLAFTGTEITGASAINLIKSLVHDNIIHERQIAGGKSIFSVATEQVNEAEIQEMIKKLSKETKTIELVEEAGLEKVFVFRPKIANRFVVKIATVNDLKSKVGSFNNQTMAGQHKNKIPVLLCFARDDKESDALFKLIQEMSIQPVPSGAFPICFIDMSHAQLSNDSWVRYLDAKARQIVLLQRNPEESGEYSDIASGVLSEWKKSMETSDFSIWFIPAEKEACRVANLEDMQNQLEDVDRFIYKYAFELQADVIDNMYTAKNLKQGAYLGIKEEVSGTFKNNQKPLEKVIDGAWKKPKYWEESPGILISKIKIFVDGYIRQAFEISGEVSINALYAELQLAPYGFMNCNLSAFLMGFLLKEYTQNMGEFYASDGSLDTVLSQEKLRDLIEDVIKDAISPPTRNREQFIKEKSKEETKFAQATSEIFELGTGACFVGKVREMLRSKLKTYHFPLLCLREVVNGNTSSVSTQIMRELIEKYAGVANTSNYGEGDSKEMQLVKEIGDTFIQYPSAINDLSDLVKKPSSFIEGMRKYIEVYKNGELKITAEKISSSEEYLNRLHEKFSKVDSANWAWNQETADRRIDEVIDEYKVIAESRQFGIVATSFLDLLEKWTEQLRICRISYDAAKGRAVQENDFFEMIVTLRKTGKIVNTSEFLNLMIIHKVEISRFFSSGLTIFKGIAQALLVDLEDNQKDEVFSRMSTDVFILDKTSYWREVEKVVNEYVKGLGRQKMRNAWKKKTKSNMETPRDWSLHYRVPVVAIAPLNERDDAKQYFAIINQNSPDAKQAEEALKYMEKITWWDDLESEEKRNEAFARGVSKEYAKLISVKDAQEYLLQTVTDEPYFWYSNDTVQNKLRELAQIKYNSSGVERAIEIIERLEDPNKVKEYLLRLVKDNMTIGLEIIGESEG